LAERTIRKESQNSKVLFVTSHDGHETEPMPVRKSCAVRQTSAAELVAMVRQSAASEQAGISEADGFKEWRGDGPIAGGQVLTTREREVAKLLAEGRTVRSAAEILGLSIKTVDAHKFNLMRKLGIHNKAELVMWAIQKRVVRMPARL